MLILPMFRLQQYVVRAQEYELLLNSQRDELQIYKSNSQSLGQSLSHVEQALAQSQKEVFDCESRVAVLQADNALLKQDYAFKQAELDNLKTALDHLTKDKTMLAQRTASIWETKLKEKEAAIENILAENTRVWEAK
jgi:predicted  nucleic acid-binding Zn-ribbon protein